MVGGMSGKGEGESGGEMAKRGREGDLSSTSSTHCRTHGPLTHTQYPPAAICALHPPAKINHPAHSNSTHTHTHRTPLPHPPLPTWCTLLPQLTHHTTASAPAPPASMAS